jgi:subtilase family serine protease
MKYKLTGLVFVMGVILVFVAALMQPQETKAQIQKQVIQLKPDYVPVIEVSQNPDGSLPVTNGGSYNNGPAYLTLKVKNDGGMDSTHASKVNYTIHHDKMEIKNVSNQNLPGGIKKGQSQTVLEKFKMEGLGQWTITISVDAAKEINESNENNNGATFYCTCQKLY